MAKVVANDIGFNVQRIGRKADPDARTVVFVHGLVMDNLSSWYFTVANKVARNADVILYDLRGHGRSERPDSGYRVEDMVDDLAALLDALAVERPVYLVGNSYGGLLAVAFAVAHPERVGGIALVDAHYSAAGWTDQMAGTLELEGDERNAMIAESFKDWLGRHSERKTSKLAKTAEALVHGTTLVRDIRASRALTDEDLAGIACPVLAIYGEDSDALDRGKHLERVLPNCELRIWPGCTHSVLWERTADVRDALATWLGGAP